MNVSEKKTQINKKWKALSSLNLALSLISSDFEPLSFTILHHVIFYTQIEAGARGWSHPRLLGNKGKGRVSVRM